MISKHEYIENLIEDYPESIEFFLDLGLSLFVCGEPAWGTIEEFCKSKGYSTEQIDEIIANFNLKLRS